MNNPCPPGICLCIRQGTSRPRLWNSPGQQAGFPLVSSCRHHHFLSCSHWASDVLQGALSSFIYPEKAVQLNGLFDSREIFWKDLQHRDLLQAAAFQTLDRHRGIELSIPNLPHPPPSPKGDCAAPRPKPSPSPYLGI